MLICKNQNIKCWKYVSFQVYKYAMMQLDEHATIQVCNYKSMQLCKYKGVSWVLTWLNLSGLHLSWRDLTFLNCPVPTRLVPTLPVLTWTVLIWPFPTKPFLTLPDLTWPVFKLKLEVVFQTIQIPPFYPLETIFTLSRHHLYTQYTLFRHLPDTFQIPTNTFQTPSRHTLGTLYIPLRAPDTLNLI